MFLHAPFPNTVFALDLNNDGKILWKYEPKQDPNVIPVMCCDTVNRGLVLRRRQDLPASGRHDACRARREDRRGRVVGEGRRSVEGPDRHRRAVRLQGQGIHRRVRRRVRRALAGSAPTISRTASSCGAAIRWVRIPTSLVDPEKTTALGKPIGADSSAQDLAGRSVEDRRRRRPGAGIPTIPN